MLITWTSRTYLIEHIAAEGYLEGIVDDQGATQLEGLAIAHEEGSDDQDPGQVDGHHAEGEHWVLHQREARCSRICGFSHLINYRNFAYH